MYTNNAQGPVAGMLNTAGWVSACQRRGGSPVVVTPSGPVSPAALRPEEVTSSAVRVAGRSRRTVPTTAKTVVKDLREVVRARQFVHLVLNTRLTGKPRYVWQRHELFHTAGVMLAKRSGCPLVIFAPSTKVWEGRNWGVRRPGWGKAAEFFGEAAILRKANLVACVSDEVAEEVCRLGVSDPNVIVTPSTVDCSLFYPRECGAAMKRWLGVDGDFVLGWTGSFRAFHGLEGVLEAVEDIRQDVANVTLLLVGEGPERPRLEREVERRGLQRQVIFAGQVSQHKLPDYLAAMDACVVWGRTDQIFHYSPLKLWEYLAVGKPVIAPRTGPIPKMMRHDVEGLLAAPGDVRELVQYVRALIDSPEMRRRLSEGGRRLALTNSWDHQLQRVETRLDVGPV